MNDPMKLAEGVSCNMIRNRGAEDVLSWLEGTWISEHWRQRKSGSMYLLEIYQHKNVITNTAKARLFDTMFNAAVQNLATDWRASLVNSSPTPAYGAGDTMAAKGWTEWTNYVENPRPVWGQGFASGVSITNATPIQFTMSANGSVHGLFIVNNSIKGDTSGSALLWSASPYTSPVVVVTSDQIRSTYSLSA